MTLYCLSHLWAIQNDSPINHAIGLILVIPSNGPVWHMQMNTHKYRSCIGACQLNNGTEWEIITALTSILLSLWHHLRYPPKFELGVKGSACQGWVVGKAPTDLQNGPTNGSATSTPLPIKRLSLAFPKGRVWRADAPALSNRTSLAWAAKSITAATPGLGTLVC